jgi:hypothetical protein
MDVALGRLLDKLVTGRPRPRDEVARRAWIGGEHLEQRTGCQRPHGLRGLEVFGALVGALLMGSLNNGMSLMNVATFYQDTARGVVLLLAVALDQYSRSRR